MKSKCWTHNADLILWELSGFKRENFHVHIFGMVAWDMKVQNQAEMNHLISEFKTFVINIFMVRLFSCLQFLSL